MPSFLHKVFSRKKDERESSRPTKRSSATSLLEGKFEAVSPTISPSAAHFSESSSQAKEKEKEKEKEREKDAGFSLFRARSRPVSPSIDAPKPTNVPHLTLNLPVPKEEKSRALGVVFEADPDNRNLLPDNVIGARRLSPLETLLLVKSCSSAIIDRGGLESLGVMHPHWYSASPDVQRKLISLFILSLAPKSPITTLSPTPTSPLTVFTTELEYTRSPHDIAAVLRWALRHLRLEGDSFGGSSGQWQWYSAFLEAERASSYPPSAFSEILVPQLPPAHLQLLVATLEIISSLAAHSERNGISGSKLSKLFGLWLLAETRTQDNDNWSTFYARWERAGRILEHLFLAQIRDEMIRKKMPLRLSELVASYPFNKGTPVESAPDGDLLPRPRLSTRRYDALYVRIDTQLPDHTTAKPKQHPLRLIADAIKADANTDSGEHIGVWDAVKKAAVSGDTDGTEPQAQPEGYPTLSRVFADETIRLLSLIPAGSSDAVTPVINLYSSPTDRLHRLDRGRATSLGSPNGYSTNGKVAGNGTAHGVATSSESAAPSQSPSSPKDWTDFSAIGFGPSTLGNDFAATLLDNDLEVTRPPAGARKPRRRASSPERSRRSSVDNPKSGPAGRPAPRPTKSKSTLVSITQLDEAFIDFWSDALLDPITSDWPSFVVCQLKPLPGVEADGKPIGWLVVEQVFTHPPPPPEPQPVSPTSPQRASSPRPSLRSNVSASRKSSTFSATRKRFTFFSPTQTITPGSPDLKPAARKKATQSARVGEMGEILVEEPESNTVVPPAKSEGAEETKGLGLSGVDVGAGASAPEAQSTPAEEPAKTKASELPPIPVIESQPVSATDEPPATISSIHSGKEHGKKLVVSAPQDVVASTDALRGASHDDVSELEPLPPAPEPVVLSGETPGPQVALSTSEPAALADVAAHLQGEDEQSSSLVNTAGTNLVKENNEASPQPTHVPVQKADDVSLHDAVGTSALEHKPAKEGLSRAEEPTITDTSNFIASEEEPVLDLPTSTTIHPSANITSEGSAVDPLAGSTAQAESAGMQLEVPSSQVPEVASSQDIPASEGAEDVGSSGEKAAASAVQEKLPEADKATEEPDSPEDQQSEPLTAGDAPEILHAQNMSPEDSGQEEPHQNGATYPETPETDLKEPSPAPLPEDSAAVAIETGES